VIAPPEHEAAARRAMLARLATGMAIVAETPPTLYTCCWQPYTYKGDAWLWRFCNGNPPGTLATPPCDHWHHQWEVFIA
jgi:hypothetical protein